MLGRKEKKCQEHVNPTRRNSGNKSWNWCVRAGRTPNELAREFKPSAETIRNWIEQAEIDAGKRQDGLTSDEKQKLNRPRRENKHLRLEREILARAAAWFARETGSIPNESSVS